MSITKYQSGFGNEFATEALAGTLPVGQNSPQVVAHGLYAEQLSGTAFTAPRAENKRTWFYRIRPSVLHTGKSQKIEQNHWQSPPYTEVEASPDQMRWNSLASPETPTDFIDGMQTIAGSGDVDSGDGCSVHLYCANKSMENRFFYNADGEMLFLPEKGAISINSEMGLLEVTPGELAVVPKGIRFQVCFSENDFVRGYVCENYGRPFELPNLGPIGANGLANPRDFLAPVAKYEDREGKFHLVAKFLGNLWTREIQYSPLDVVAWHGNFYPYKYDLSCFQAMNTVNFDHPDPSIFTVLTSPSGHAGTANIDLAIFPPRWMVAEKTFRPPYFHRNCMSEFMGLILGEYDGKADGFVPGGCSLHNRMSAHGPDTATFKAASEAELKPVFQGGTLAFMCETRLPYRLTKFAYNTELRQRDYPNCWHGLQSNFHPDSSN